MVLMEFLNEEFQTTHIPSAKEIEKTNIKRDFEKTQITREMSDNAPKRLRTEDKEEFENIKNACESLVWDTPSNYNNLWLIAQIINTNKTIVSHNRDTLVEIVIKSAYVNHIFDTGSLILYNDAQNQALVLHVRHSPTLEEYEFNTKSVLFTVVVDNDKKITTVDVLIVVFTMENEGTCPIQSTVNKINQVEEDFPMICRIGDDELDANAVFIYPFNKNCWNPQVALVKLLNTFYTIVLTDEQHACPAGELQHTDQ